MIKGISKVNTYNPVMKIFLDDLACDLFKTPIINIFYDSTDNVSFLAPGYCM